MGAVGLRRNGRGRAGERPVAGRAAAGARTLLPAVRHFRDFEFFSGGGDRVSRGGSGATLSRTAADEPVRLHHIPRELMATILAENHYGKSRVRLLKVERHGGRHDLKDVSVDIALGGDFDASYTEGDNRLVLPTDTMKNTVYALARREPVGEIEEFGLRLAEHFLARNAQVS